MIKHIVMFKLKEYATNEEKLSAMHSVKKNFESLVPIIIEINNYDVGINISKSSAAYDVVINADFENLEKLQKYSTHPAHIKAVEFNKQFSVDKKVVDYEY